MPAPSETDTREKIVETMQAMAARGLNRGTSGNVSARLGEGLLVTPTGIVPEEMTPRDIVHVAADGSVTGDLRPSSEWRMHQRILERRPDCRAVLHCHSRYATILACAGKPIPPLHYMVGVSGRSSIPVAPYRVFGSAELADVVAETMEGGLACLMANHGQIVVATGLGRALAIAEEIEEQAAVYCGTLAIGGPTLLDEGQMAEIFERFAQYGQKKGA
jgi:L-fuculose-phosphate aldolase